MRTLKTLSNSAVIETESNEEFDQLARIASFVTKTPIAVISFIDEDCEWFKSITGMGTSLREIPLDNSFGSQVIAHKDDMLHIQNPLVDDRTRRNPLINSFNEIGMIAGVPIEEDGWRFGALYVIGYKYRDLSDEQITSLKTIASQIAILIQLKNALKEIKEMAFEYEGKELGLEADGVENGQLDESVESGFVASNVNTAPVKSGELDVIGESFSGAEYDKDAANGIARLLRSKDALTKLSEMGEMLQGAGSVEDINTIVVKYSRMLFPDFSGALYILNESSDHFEDYSRWGAVINTEHAFSTDQCWAFRLGKIHSAISKGTDLFCQHVVESESFSCVCAPFLASGKVSGLLYFQDNRFSNNAETNEGSQINSSENQFVISKIAKLAGLSIGNIRHKETLGVYAVFDSLTKLYNRRYMEETLKRELSRASRNQESLGLIMLDVDHFKKFNDAYGHAAGDTLLRSIGKFLMDNVRKEDVACRYGGEEFVLILPGCSLEHTIMRAEQIRENIKKLRVWHRGRSIDCINVSIGVGLYSDHGNTVESLLEAADDALYKAKSNGRDRIEIART